MGSLMSRGQKGFLQGHRSGKVAEQGQETKYSTLSSAVNPEEHHCTAPVSFMQPILTEYLPAPAQY